MTNKILISALIVFFSGSASAGGLSHQPTRLDFNKMIDANARMAKELKKDLNKKYEAREDSEKTAQAEKAKAAAEKKVIDFVDVEVGVGQSPKIVDRRFNSVGAPIVDPNPPKAIPHMVSEDALPQVILFRKGHAPKG